MATTKFPTRAIKPRTVCSAGGCTASVPSHYWGCVKADDWFFQKDGKSWCPNHHPEWVAEWREYKKRVGK